MTQILAASWKSLKHERLSDVMMYLKEKQNGTLNCTPKLRKAKGIRQFYGGSKSRTENHVGDLRDHLSNYIQGSTVCYAQGKSPPAWEILCQMRLSRLVFTISLLTLNVLIIHTLLSSEWGGGSL